MNDKQVAIQTISKLPEDCSMAEIAEELHLSVKTIEYYREQIKRKLNLRNAAELTQHATAWVQREIPT